MRIRLAHPGDAAAVNELLGQLGYPQDHHETTSTRIQAWADDPSSAAYVAEADGGVLGIIAAHICPFFERGGSFGRIVALVVSDRARRQGVGSRLVAAAESFCAGRGCVRMEVTSANRREDAHEFYQGRGYVNQKARSSRFLRDLDGSGTEGLGSRG